MMIYFEWFAGIILLSFIFTFISLNIEKVNLKKLPTNIIVYSKNDYREIGNLRIENVDSMITSRKSLNMRGSWRLAKDQVFGLEEFNAMKAVEYTKKI